MKVIRGDELFRSFEGFTRASDRLMAIAAGVCPRRETTTSSSSKRSTGNSPPPGGVAASHGGD